MKRMIRAAADTETKDFNGRKFSKTDYFVYQDGALYRNVAAGLFKENMRPYRVSPNYNLYVMSFPGSAYAYSVYLIADKSSGEVWRLEVPQGHGNERQWIKELMEDLKR